MSGGLQEKMHQSDKMAALGQLSSGVAHDVNNDLGVIVGSAELILEESAHGSREEVLSSRIIATVKRSTDLVRRMLAFSRQADIAPEPLDLVVFLQGFIDTLGRTLGAHIHTRLRLADRTQDYWVSLDRSMLESSLINLAINARDAMPTRRMLTFSLTCERCGRDEPDIVLLTVADTGTGMSETVRRRIFEPFFTTKPAGGGTGLGLAMVYGFVQQSGGRIDVASEVGAGTRFLLRFPKVPPPSTAAGDRTKPAETEKRAHRVLLVDDNAALRVTLREQLASLNCIVHEAADFEQAANILRSGEPVGFILSDFDLGSGADGMALARWAGEMATPFPAPSCRAISSPLPACRRIGKAYRSRSGWTICGCFLPPKGRARPADRLWQKQTPPCWWWKTMTACVLWWPRCCGAPGTRRSKPRVRAMP